MRYLKKLERIAIEAVGRWRRQLNPRGSQGAAHAVFACAGLESNPCTTQLRSGGRLTHFSDLSRLLTSFPLSSFLHSSFWLLVSSFISRHTVSSTPLFSSPCKIFRTNDGNSLNTSTIKVFDKLCNSCQHGS